MRTTTLLVLSLIAPAVLVGCDSDDGAKKDAAKTDSAKKGGEKGDKAAQGEAKDAKKDGAEKAAAGPLDLPKTGLKGTAPANSSVSEMMGSDMVQGPNLTVTVSNVDGDAKTIEAVKEDADMYGPKNMKEEKLDDGFIVSFTNEGAAGTNYWVQAFRTFDGKQFECSTTASSEAQQTGAIAFCKSLTK